MYSGKYQTKGLVMRDMRMLVQLQLVWADHIKVPGNQDGPEEHQ